MIIHHHQSDGWQCSTVNLGGFLYPLTHALQRCLMTDGTTKRQPREFLEQFSGHKYKTLTFYKHGRPGTVSAYMELSGTGTNGNWRDILILHFFPRGARCVVSLLSSFQVATGATS